MGYRMTFTRPPALGTAAARTLAELLVEDFSRRRELARMAGDPAAVEAASIARSQAIMAREQGRRTA